VTDADREERDAREREMARERMTAIQSRRSLYICAGSHPVGVHADGAMGAVWFTYRLQRLKINCARGPS